MILYSFFGGVVIGALAIAVLWYIGDNFDLERDHLDCNSNYTDRKEGTDNG